MAPAALRKGAAMSQQTGHHTATAKSHHRRDRVVHARFSTSELERISSAADLAGMTVSGFLRSLVLEGAGVQPFFSDDDRAILDVLVFDIRAIGINLHQISRELNRGRSPASADVASTVTAASQLVAGALIEMRRYATRGGQACRGRG